MLAAALAGGLAREQLERHVAAVLPQKSQELLVIAGRHVEAAYEHLVIADRVLKSEAHDLANLVAGEVARHERFVHSRPERFLPLDHPREQLLVNSAGRDDTHGYAAAA